MKIKVEYQYTQNFLPTKRHKKIKYRKMQGSMNITIRELTTEEFPIAFIVNKWESVCEGMKSYSDYDNCKCDFKVFAEEIRTYNGELRKPVRITHGTAISTLFEDYTYILNNVKWSLRNSRLNSFDNYPFEDNSNEFTENSVVIDDNKKQVENYIRKITKSYIYCDGKFWSVCSEPRYVINTFGLGHNHGGTSMFIDYHYNPNIPSDNYFNALQRDEAVAYGQEVAARRGDTESIKDMGDNRLIEVLMPEMVKVKPNEQHGKGNDFINTMESLIDGSSSVTDAGILCMAFAMASGAKSEK